MAKLARLGLAEKEIEKYQKELSKILDYIDKLKEVDITGVEPMSHPMLIKNVMRQDKQAISDKQQATRLLGLAPDVKNGHLKVKSIWS